MCPSSFPLNNYFSFYARYAKYFSVTNSIFLQAHLSLFLEDIPDIYHGSSLAFFLLYDLPVPNQHNYWTFWEHKYLHHPHDYNDVFADILNVLLFKYDYINPNELKDGDTESIYKAEYPGMRNQYRDTSKYYNNAGIIISKFGMENESKIDYDMPIRIMGYDYGSYRKQIDNGSARYPIITIVLNFSESRWKNPLCLKDVLDIPEGMEEFVEDYKIKVFDIAYLSDETINEFKSTFKHVAHFFKNRRMLDNYEPLDEEIEHLEEFLDLLRIFTGDEKYIEIKDGLLKKQKEGQVVTMCTVVEKFTNEGIARGIEQGIEQDQNQIIVNMQNQGCDNVTISKLTGIPLDKVNKVLEH